MFANRSLVFESLESRNLLAAQPIVTLDAPDEVMIGESFEVAVAFDNADATDAGYGPYVDLLVPVNGQDGTGGVGADGLSFNSASYLGAPVNTTVLTFPNDSGGTGEVDHPYAVDTAGAPLTITGNAGDQLVVMQLPFGSFTADQPAAVITVDMSLSNQADLGQPLSLRARSGFQYGNTPVEDPATDPSLVSDAGTSANGWTTAEAIEPTLVDLTKIYIGPEDETATGPNFPRQYTIEIDIANGQTITNLDVSDLLPNNVELISVDTVTPAGTTTTFPATPANAPNNALVVNLPTATGTTADVDATVTFSFFVPFRDADGDTVIDPVSGDDVTSLNNVSIEGDWTPLDTRDPSGTNNVTVDVAGPEHVLTPKSIATQKSVALLSDPAGNGVSPGDVLEYAIQIQISDYFGFDNLVLTDVISDGQRFDTSFTPTLQFTEHGTSTGVFALDNGNYGVTDKFTGSTAPVAPLDGTQVIEVRLSDQLVSRRGNGVALGGLVPTNGTGAADPSSTDFDGGATTGTLIFRTVVQEEFTDTFPSGDESVDEGDELTNDVSIVGDVLAFADATPTGQVEADVSAAAISVPAGSLVKSIYAVNGNTTLPSPLILSPGDEITYRLQLSLPTSDVEQLAIEDYLPLPVLLAGEVTTFVDTLDATVPAAGLAKFGPDDTFRAIYGSTPGLAVNAGSNQITFDYGDFDIVGGTAQDIDILFTVTASDDPFADGLLLTNQARRVQDTTNAGNFTNDAIIQVVLGQPSLQITKGIVATDNPAADFSSAIGPVGFSAPGSSNYRGDNPITSDGLAASPINANVEDIDGGDLVTFAIVLENVGSSRAGAFDVRLKDTQPADFVIPNGGLNLTVTDGTGAVIPFTEINGGLFDSTGGIELSDPGPTAATADLTNAGAIDQYNATSGRNIMVLTYDLEVRPEAEPNQSILNTATLTNYAGAELGPDFTTVDPTDTATALIAPLAVSKTIVGTNHANTTSNDVAIGEIVTYRAVVTVPEGESGNVTLIDIPDAGLSVIDILSVTPSSGDLTLSTGTFADVQTASSIATNGDSISLIFPGLENANRDDSTVETITVEYRTVVLNREANDRGDDLNNLATVTWANGAAATSAPNVEIVEPTLVVDKTIVPVDGQGTDQFVVTLNLSHSGASDADAFEVTLADALPSGLTFVGSLTNPAGKVPSTLSQNSGTITATYNELLLGETSQLQFVVELDQDLEAGVVVTNTATSDWSSLPGDVTGPLSGDSLSSERTGIVGDLTNDYIASDVGTVTVFNPEVDKTLIATNQTHTSGLETAVGEIVTYRATLTIPQASLAGATFTDTPAAGLAIVDVLSLTASSNLSASTGSMTAIAAAAVIPTDGSSLTLDFGTLTNADVDSSVDETIVVEYRAVVLNTAGNDRGDTLDNDATIAWASTRSVDASAVSVTVVEPQLTVDVATAAPPTADAGDTVEFTVTVAHAAGSDADAFDVSLENLIDSATNHLGYVPGSLVITGTGGAVLDSQSDTAGDLSAVWTEFPLGATATLTFDVLVLNTAPAQTDLNNNATIDWTSLPTAVDSPQSSNAVSVERTGNTAGVGGNANDHRDNDAGFVRTTTPLSSKTVVGSSLTQSGNGEHDLSLTDLLIDEQVTFSITASLPEGTSPLTITDQLPTGVNGVIELISIQVTSVGANLSLPVGAPTETRSDTDADSVDDLVTLDFGSVLNTPDGVVNAADEIVVTVVGRVVDAPSNVNGLVLTNTSTVDFGSGQVISTADVEIIEPELQIDKTGTPTVAPAGSVVDYTLVVTHTAGSTSDAYDAIVTDLLADANLTLLPGTVTSSVGTVTTGNGASDSTVAVALGDFVRGETATITFRGRVNPDLQTGIAVNNTSGVAWDSLPADAGRPGTNSDPATLSTSAPEIDLRITKTDSVDPVTVDDPFSYTITVINDGPSTATGVTIVDTLPPSIFVTDTDVTTSQGTSSLVGNLLTINVGTLRPGESTTVEVDAMAPSTEQIVTNQATVSANENDTDPSNDTATEPTEVVAKASVAGVNWVDTNGDGIVGTDEITLPGTTLTLTGTDILGNLVSVDTVSGPNGEYLFDDLRPGNYVITQEQPSLFVDSDDYVGSVSGAVYRRHPKSRRRSNRLQLF